MKVFNVMFSKFNGGLEQVFLNYIPTLQAQGNHVISIIHPDAQIKESCPQKNLISVHNYNQYDFVAVYKLRQLILQHQPDCIIMHSHRAAYLLKKTMTNVPKIAVCHVSGNYDFGADAIIAITEKMRQDIIDSGVPPEKVFTVSNMIHIPDDRVYREPKENKVPVIGVCSRFSKNKGVDLFIEALAELKRRNVVFKAKIAGDGKQRDALNALVIALDLQNEVDFLGWVNDRDAFYQDLDIFCLPSREEAFGLVVLESMSYSLPIILPQLSGPMEIVDNSESAFIVAPNNYVQLADGLEQIIKDKHLAKSLGYKAFQRVQAFSTQKVSETLQRALEKVSKNH